ncbi:MAG: hypothetical protein U5L01_04530 [Rheinheimera sp.]|nr:hypothetical protein [Rheinheimera sp.]
MLPATSRIGIIRTNFVANTRDPERDHRRSTQRKWLDNANFWFCTSWLLGANFSGWALLLIMIFSLQLGWLPTSGRIGVLYEVPHHTGFMLLDIWLSDLLLANMPHFAMH